jgi:hypothetical protein
MSQYLVSHYSTLTSGKHDVLNVQGHVSPSEVSFFLNDIRFLYKYLHQFNGCCLFLVWVQKHPGSLLEGFTKTQVSTLAVRDKFLVAGGFQGELICKVSSRVLQSWIFSFSHNNYMHSNQGTSSFSTLILFSAS